MYSNFNFIKMISSLKPELFKSFNSVRLSENDYLNVDTNDKIFIAMLNEIKNRNGVDSVIKDLLSNLDLFDFIYSKKNIIEEASNKKEAYEILANEYKTLYTLHNNKSVHEKFTLEEYGNIKFRFKNLLFKGVPGTGKSYTIDAIITKELNLDKNSDNVLRINIHSASSNADLMQGIGISATSNNQIEYREKQGLIFDQIRKACFAPNQSFVLVLEEVQENSLNELIGDLIYLVEPTKRVVTKELLVGLNETEYPYFSSDGEKGIIELYKKKAQELSKTFHSVKIPYLVSTQTEYREMILPDNLYVFCTSNYRDDKKVVEDNLLRRFDVIEIYPKYIKDGVDYRSKSISKFLEYLNESIREHFDKQEIHPDRFMIGHANWIKIEDNNNKDKDFAKALLKVFIEFKEIREIDYIRNVSAILNILKKKIEEDQSEDKWAMVLFTTWNNDQMKSYYDWVQALQKTAYPDLAL